MRFLLTLLFLASCTQEPAIIVKKGEVYYSKDKMEEQEDSLF